MASLIRPTRPYRLPAKPDLVEKDGKPHVRIKEGKKTALYPLTKDRTQYLKPAAKWAADVRFADGRRRRVRFSPNREAAAVMLADLLKKIENEKAGIRTEFTDHRARTLSELLAEYQQHATDRNVSAKQAAQTRRRCEKVFDGCGFVTLAHLDGVAAERWLAERRKIPKSRGGISAQTSNHYITALKAFGAWLVMTRKSPENPFQFVVKGNVDVDIRHVRRSLAADEFNRLLTAARGGDSYRGMCGRDRAVLYLVAGMTGLRASELASLTPGSFTLSAETPTVAVEAAYSKHRRRDEVPLHPDLVAELRKWIDDKPAGQVLWGGKWAKQCSAAAMIRRDLSAARAAWVGEAATELEKSEREQSDFLRYRDQEGQVVDFHALRHTFVTNLVNAGVTPKDAKELARHSTISLTMDRYAHVGIRDTAAAVAKLTIPTSLRPATEANVMRATGTDFGSAPKQQKGMMGAAPGAATVDCGKGGLRKCEEMDSSDDSPGESSEPLRIKVIEGHQEGPRTIDKRRGRDSKLPFVGCVHSALPLTSR